MPTASEFMDSGKVSGHKAWERSNFSWTCSRLSQYLRENGGFGDLTLGLSFNPDAISGKLDTTEQHKPVAVTPEEQPQGIDDTDGNSLKLFPQYAGFGGASSTDKTLTLSPAGVVPKEGGGSAKMTIFYAGKMVVFEDVPAEKAEAVMQYVGGGTAPKLQPATKTNASYLPLARKASLQRFLEMRKGRLSSRAPYKTNNSTPTASKQDEKSPTALPQSTFPVSLGLSMPASGFGSV